MAATNSTCSHHTFAASLLAAAYSPTATLIARDRREMIINHIYD
jgi:hypothetical protein